MHNEDFSRPFRPAEIIKQPLLDYYKGKNIVESDYLLQPRTETVVTWLKPPEGWIKLNVDGALRRSLKVARCGGILCDEDGRWLGGFYRFLNDCSILKAGVWVVLEGMRLAAKFGVDCLELESDSLNLVTVVNGGDGGVVDIHDIVISICLFSIHRLAIKSHLARVWVVIAVGKS